jgi:hypothetical protein
VFAQGYDFPMDKSLRLQGRRDKTPSDADGRSSIVHFGKQGDAIDQGQWSG